MAAMDVPLSSEATAALAQPAPTSPALQPAADVKPRAKAIPIAGRNAQPANAALSSSYASSPNRLRSASPRLHSPASSEIFERNVQEPVPISTLSGEPSAHLPAHVITEDHIPPALEATAQAITSQELNPDEVEIVTTSTHQTAASSVLEGSTSHVDIASLNSPLTSQKSDDGDMSASQSQLLPTANEDDPNYGSIDPNDVRRLSFISFADVVQAEHQQAPTSAPSEVEGQDDAPASTSLSSQSSMPPGIARAASPLRSPRSPASSHGPSGVATPPLIAARAIANAEQSPSRSLGVGSPAGAHGVLTIETMRQAVRKTASGDMGQTFKSPAISPVLPNDDQLPVRNRTNS